MITKTIALCLVGLSTAGCTTTTERIVVIPKASVIKERVVEAVERCNRNTIFEKIKCSIVEE